MSIVGVAAISFVSAQLCLTAVLQPLHRRPWVTRLDRAAIAPMWMFFAYGTLGEDWHLMIRDGEGEKPMTEWSRVPRAAPRTLVQTLWNPGKLRQMHVITLMDALVRRSGSEPDVGPDESRSYAKLLALAKRSAVGVPAGSSRQFAVVRTSPGQAPEWLFTSRFHPLP